MNTKMNKSNAKKSSPKKSKSNPSRKGGRASIKSKSRKSRRHSYKNSSSMLHKLFQAILTFILKIIITIVIILIALKIIYNLLPDCINLDFIVINQQDLKQEVHDLVHQELNSLTIENSELPIDSDTQSEPIAKVEPTKKTEVIEKAEVTSRGGLDRPNSPNFSTKATYYHPGDDYGSSNRTGSGLTTSDFSTTTLPSGTRVYTYQNKLVVATATSYLFNAKGVKDAYKQEGKHYFKYYDTFKTELEGKQYECIVLDSCGAAMWASNPKRGNRLLYSICIRPCRR